jgi:hypothetical protein
MDALLNEVQKRELRGAQSSFNEDDRTFEVCWTTGARVKRYSWDDGYYMEELVVDKKTIRLDRFNAMSFLDTHDNYSMDQRLGTVVPGSVRIEGGKGYARIKLSKRQRAEEIFQDLKDGHPLPVSVGYKIHKFEKSEGVNGGLPIIRAVDWEPMEISAVPIPADPHALSRSEEINMPENEIDELPIEQRQAPINTRPDTVRERKRVTELRGLARLVPNTISEAELDAAIDNGTPVDTFRSALLDKIVERQSTNPTFPHVETRGMGGTFDDPDFFRRNAAEALLARTRGKEPEGAAAAVFADGEAAFARRCLLNEGRDIRGWSDERVKRGYLTTSDFAYISGTVANTRIVDYYQESLSQLPQLFGRRTVPDFNVHTQAFVDWTVMDIDKVNEHGEFKSSYIDEGGESIQVRTWGGIVPLTRQLIVNAAGALENMSKMQGQALAGKVNAEMAAYPQMSAFAGPKMKDGVTVFHSSRGNIENLLLYAGQDPSMQLMQFRAKMARRKGKGDIVIGTYPKFWLVHPDFEGQAIKILAAVQASSVADVNPIAGRLTIISDPRLTSETKSWLVCDPAAMEGAVRVYLEGEEVPHTDSEVGFEIDGVKFKIRHDFGFGWLEWRSWTRLDHVTVAP